jgi:hypothetical protein
VAREKQIEFPPQQTHRKGFEVFMVLTSVVFIVVAIIIILTYTGSFIGPWG